MPAAGVLAALVNGPAPLLPWGIEVLMKSHSIT